MPAGGVEVRPTIDREWLERAESAEPLTHAYALWDLTRTPQLVRFASAIRGETTVGYLLLWLGAGDRPVVHWFGPLEELKRRADELGRHQVVTFTGRGR